MTVLSTLLKADGMGLVEKLSEWLLRRERKAAHLRADNRASPTASLTRDQKEASGEENQNVGQP